MVTSSAIDCDAINRTKTERVRPGNDVLRSFISSLVDSLCRVRNEIMYVRSWRTVSALNWVLFRCTFASLLRKSGNKHQNNPLVSAETVRHSSIYTCLYISNHTTEQLSANCNIHANLMKYALILYSYHVMRYTNKYYGTGKDAYPPVWMTVFKFKSHIWHCCSSYLQMIPHWINWA